MKGVDQWVPTKFVSKNGRLRANRDRSRVSPASRLLVDQIGSVYSEMIPRYCRGQLLDLGCGHVPLYETYKSLVDEITCLDWAESVHKNVHLDFIHDLTRPLPLESDSYDTIICSDVMEHIPNPHEVWAEVARVLRPQGKLLLNVPFMYGLHEAPYDFHRYTHFAIRRYCEMNELEVLLLRPYGGTLDVVADMLAKTFLRIPAVGLPACISAQFLSSLAGKLGIRPKLKKFPLFYFLVAEKTAV